MNFIFNIILVVLLIVVFVALMIFMVYKFKKVVVYIDKHISIPISYENTICAQKDTASGYNKLNYKFTKRDNNLPMVSYISAKETFFENDLIYPKKYLELPTLNFNIIKQFPQFKTYFLKIWDLFNNKLDCVDVVDLKQIAKYTIPVFGNLCYGTKSLEWDWANKRPANATVGYFDPEKNKFFYNGTELPDNVQDFRKTTFDVLYRFNSEYIESPRYYTYNNCTIYGLGKIKLPKMVGMAFKLIGNIVDDHFYFSTLSFIVKVPFKLNLYLNSGLKLVTDTMKNEEYGKSNGVCSFRLNYVLPDCDKNQYIEFFNIDSIQESNVTLTQLEYCVNTKKLTDDILVSDNIMSIRNFDKWTGDYYKQLNSESFIKNDYQTNVQIVNEFAMIKSMLEIV